MIIFLNGNAPMVGQNMGKTEFYWNLPFRLSVHVYVRLLIEHVAAVIVSKKKKYLPSVMIKHAVFFFSDESGL